MPNDWVALTAADLEWLLAANPDDNAEAAFWIAYCHFKGTGGVQTNNKTAVLYFEKAAKHNHPKALWRLARCHYWGDGISKDRTRATQLFQKAHAALQAALPEDPNDAQAQLLLGRSYELGYGGLNKDYVRAFSLYQQAAQQGHLEGQYNVGYCLEYGRGGVTQDCVQAAGWYGQAARQGHSTARMFFDNLFAQKAELKEQLAAVAQNGARDQQKTFSAASALAYYWTRNNGANSTTAQQWQAIADQCTNKLPPSWRPPILVERHPLSKSPVEEERRRTEEVARLRQEAERWRQKAAEAERRRTEEVARLRQEAERWRQEEEEAESRRREEEESRRYVHLGDPLPGNTTGGESSTVQDKYPREWEPFDIFLVHTGAQKREIVAPLKDHLERQGFRCFFDMEMKPSDGSPTDYMRFALETCRHAVVVLSREFLDKGVDAAPCQELRFAFERMSWLRTTNPSQSWQSLWIVLFHVGVNDYKKNAPLPELSSEVVLLEYPGARYNSWPLLYEELAKDLQRHDAERHAVAKWNQFLESRWQVEDHPTARHLYVPQSPPKSGCSLM